MLRQIIVIFISLLCFYLPQAQGQEPERASADAGSLQQQIRAAPKRGALFKISRAEHTLFLFGTIHVGQPDFYPLEAQVTTALTEASAVALELDPLNAAPLQQAVQQYGLYPAGAAQKLPPPLQRRLSALLNKYHVPADAVAQMKPWMVAIALTLNEFAARGYQSGLAVDAYLSGFAQAQKKPLVELETAQDQLALFGKLSRGDQIRFLEDTMTEIENSVEAKKIAQLASLWRNADVAGLDRLALELARDPTFSGKFFQRTMLDGRNPALANGIEKLLVSEKNAFAGIGILHLVGAGSVPALLRQRGYTVQRIY